MRLNSSQTFNFFPVPTDIHFGCGVLSTPPERLASLGCHRPMLVTDPGLRATGVVERIAALLGSGGPGLSVFDGVRPDSGSDLIGEAASQACESGVDVVVGIGGGSSLDTAKAVAAMATNSGSILDYVGLHKIGVKDSGQGAKIGHTATEFYTNMKAVYVKWQSKRAHCILPFSHRLAQPSSAPTVFMMRWWMESSRASWRPGLS